jgi:hypothetical protein
MGYRGGGDKTVTAAVHTFSKRTCFLVMLSALGALISGCAILYIPQTDYTAQTSAVVSPFNHVSVEFNKNAPEAPLSISLGDSDSSKLRNLRFSTATMTNEDGVVTQLSLRREILENPNSFVMEFCKADYLGHDLHFCVSVRLDGEPLVITFQTRFKSKVYWPKDSDYSG